MTKWVLKDSFHRLPLLVTAGVGTAALELGDVGFPLGLSGESGQAGHVAFPVEIVHGVANHEEATAPAVDLHIQYAHLSLTLDDFRPYVRVGFDIFLYHLLVIHEREGLAVAFHVSFKFQDSGFKRLEVLSAKASTTKKQTMGTR